MVVPAFAAFVDKTYARNTGRQVKWWVGNFEVWRGTRGFDDALVRDYLALKQSQGMGAHSAHTGAYYIRIYLNWLRDHAGISVPSQKEVLYGRAEEPTRFTPSDDQVLACMQIAQQAVPQPHATVIAMLPLFGLRDAEMTCMRFDDWKVLPTGNVIFTARKTKNGQDREVPMLQTGGDNGFQALGRAILRRYLTEIRPSHVAGSPWLFPSFRFQDKHLARETIEIYIRAIRGRLQMPDLTAHAFRRFYVTYLMDRGVQAVTVAKMIGHSNMDTFSVYYRPSGAQLARAMAGGQV